MPRQRSPSARVFVRFPQDRFDLFEEWARELGLTMSDLVAICAWTGSKVVIPSLLPDAYQQLKLIQEEREREAMEDYMQGELIEFNEVLEYRANKEDYQKWLQERGLHNG